MSESIKYTYIKFGEKKNLANKQCCTLFIAVHPISESSLISRLMYLYLILRCDSDVFIGY